MTMRDAEPAAREPRKRAKAEAAQPVRRLAPKPAAARTWDLRENEVPEAFQFPALPVDASRTYSHQLAARYLGVTVRELRDLLIAPGKLPAQLESSLGKRAWVKGDHIMAMQRDLMAIGVAFLKRQSTNAARSRGNCRILDDSELLCGWVDEYLGETGEQQHQSRPCAKHIREKIEAGIQTGKRGYPKQAPSIRAILDRLKRLDRTELAAFQRSKYSRRK
jgi:hypothetical protein